MWGRVVKIALSLPFLIVAGLFGLYLVFGFFLVNPLAQKLLPKGAGSMISFGVKGGRDAGRKFIDALKLASHLANVGDAKTLVIHPASTTHRQLDEAALKAAGIGEELIRLSVGLEDVGDIIDDLAQALKASQK